MGMMAPGSRTRSVPPAVRRALLSCGPGLSPCYQLLITFVDDGA